MMARLILIITSLGGGLVVGGALAAFITLIKLIPRLVQLTETEDYIIFYQYSFLVGSITSIFLYFSKISLGLPNFLSCLIAGIMGVFIGLFSSALAEVLNVIPVLSKKLKLKKEKKYIIYALTLGKVTGSLYFWLYY